MFNKNIKITFEITPQGQYFAKIKLPKKYNPTHLIVFLNALLDGNKDLIGGLLHSIKYWGEKDKWGEVAEDVIGGIISNQHNNEVNAAKRHPIVSPTGVINHFRKTITGQNDD